MIRGSGARETRGKQDDSGATSDPFIILKGGIRDSAWPGGGKKTFLEFYQRSVLVSLLTSGRLCLPSAAAWPLRGLSVFVQH